MAVDLSIVIVNWNVAELLCACLESIFNAPGAAWREGGFFVGDYAVEVYVVDNASTDDSVARVQHTFPNVKLLASPVNLGFSAGNNLALRQARGRYALLLNPDTRLVGDALAVMLDYLEGHPEIGVLGPRLRYPDGRPQPSRRRFPTLMTAFMESTLLQQWFPRNRWAQRYYVADVPDDHAQTVDWITGACLLVRRAVIEQVGLLDENLFMYSEELDWCRRIVDAGWQVAYLPQAEVIHYEGQSSGQVVAARHIRFQGSKILYFRKHHGALQAETLRLFLLLTYLWQLGEEALKFALGHKRPLRRARLAAYAQVLRSGLRPERKAHG